MISIWDLTEYRVIDAACLLAHKDPDTVDQSKYPLPASIEAKLGLIEKRFGAIWPRGPVFAVASRDGTVTSNSRSGRRFLIQRLDVFVIALSLKLPHVKGLLHAQPYRRAVAE